MTRLTSVLVGLLVATAPAAADSAFRPGSGFQLGGVYFHVVSASSEGALFRVAERLPAHGLEEHPDCYRIARAFYHREACPVLQGFFARHGEPADTAAPAAPPGAGHASAGSHPIDYLRGSYVEAAENDFGIDGLYVHPWYGTGFVVAGRGRHGGFDRRDFNRRPGHGFGRRSGGRSFVGVSFLRW